jgi:hypothetical protein
MMKPLHEDFAQRALGAAAALIVAGAIFSASIIFHSRTFSDAFDVIVPLVIGLVVGFGLFLRWRGFWLVACVFVVIATIVHIIAVIPRSLASHRQRAGLGAHRWQHSWHRPKQQSLAILGRGVRSLWACFRESPLS